MKQRPDVSKIITHFHFQTGSFFHAFKTAVIILNVNVKIRSCVI